MNSASAPLSSLLRYCIYFWAILVLLNFTFFTLKDIVIDTYPFKVEAGIQQSLTPELITMNKLAKANDLHSFAVSKPLDEMGYLGLRAAEFLYPIRLSQDSSALFATKNELVPLGCHLLAQQQNIVLYDCR